MDKNCLTLPNIVPEEDDDTSIGSYWFLPSIFLRGEGIPIGNSQPTETITWWLFSFSLIFRKFVMKLHANFTQTRNDLFAYLQYIAVMVWYYHCKGSGRNKNLPPRRFSTVGIVVEFRRAPTQLPPQTSSLDLPTLTHWQPYKGVGRGRCCGVLYKLINLACNWSISRATCVFDESLARRRIWCPKRIPSSMVGAHIIWIDSKKLL